MAKARVRKKHRIVAEVESNLIKCLRANNGLSRVEVAREMHLAPSTAGIYIDRLKHEGFLLEGEKVDRQFGRRPTLLTPNPDAGLFVGVDLEARNLMTTVVDFSMNVVDRIQRRIPAKASAATVLKEMTCSISKVTADNQHSLLGIGVGVPGVIDVERGLASEYPFFEDWHNVPVVGHLFEQFNVPVSLENNIRSMAMAELWLGKGMGLRNFVCLGVRTGIGVGIVINGELYCGSHGGAGEIGNWPVVDQGAAASKTRTLENTVSLSAILNHAHDASGQPADLTALREAAEAGDESVLKILSEAAMVHGMTLRQLHLLLDPDRIIIVGPMAELGQVFIDRIRAEMESMDGYATTNLEVENSEFGGFGGALGAAALALHRWRPVRVVEK